MLFRYARIFYGAFEVYSVVHSTRQASVGGDAGGFGEFDVYNMTFNGYLSFVRECAIVGGSMKGKDVELIWVQV
jgi:hypothetical protein